jgi:hypothetical protein
MYIYAGTNDYIVRTQKHSIKKSLLRRGALSQFKKQELKFKGDVVTFSRQLLIRKLLNKNSE